ncbi:hypothetical protein L861_17560 [Litchfieldella anticariensis FP35 = DSM 16096]|uniref:SMODS and SLOG-associating 2TM effector domain-containing protein n=1 Tax=Litchfieldella anticariensis (strain DSM 16096 / CECT 5854 / CIP 108499 / LMG 22089 / FP35) TaxID=1121939 RepID=S2KN41_LITA3|nr:hypothetical protein [Halomonas anticariensis]EPC03350.1 hypothetical protein L861_17560 [Halomonas anticariensis FP35 = DSM 16096]
MDFNENTKISDIVFREPLDVHARKYRSVLMIISALSILLSIDGLAINKLLWIQVSDYDASKPIMLGALSVGVAYFFFGFSFYSWHDLKQWRLSKNLTKVQMAAKNLSDISVKCFAIKNYHEKINKNEYVKNEALKELSSYSSVSEKLYVHDLENLVTKVRGYINDHKKLHIGQLVKLLILDFGIPYFVAILAITKNHTYIVPFIKVVFSVNA